MKLIYLLIAFSMILSGCMASKPTRQDLQTPIESADYGNYTSATLVGKAWQAQADKNYRELFTYANKCVELYGDEGKAMNANLSAFEPPETANKQWALNDVGTSLYIMANAYVELEMYPEAVETYRKLGADYVYAQCWDPKGWFWQPAKGALEQAKRYEYLD